MADIKKVLFICTANYCRSPIAEAVFLHLLKQRGIEEKWEADSAGIGTWHIGKKPEQRAQDILAKHNVSYDNVCRQICTDDFLKFDFIFGMDDSNIMGIHEKGNGVENTKSVIQLLGDFDPQNERIIRDPYNDEDSEGFEKCFQQCMRCCEAFLDIYQ